MRSALLLAASAAAVTLVSGHNLINNAVGDAGGKALAFGVSSATSNSQADTTIFKNGKFGSTQKGAIDPAAQLAAVQKIAGDTLPQVTSQLNVTLHQINGDGAGPMACSIDTAAAGNFSADATVATNVPGNNGRSGAANQDFPLVVDVAAGTACTGTLGTVKNVCLMKCQNPAGPFGGVVPFQMASAAGAGGAAAAAAGGAAAAAGGAKAAAGGGKGAARKGGHGKNGGKKQGRWVSVEF